MHIYMYKGPLSACCFCCQLWTSA